MTKKFIADIYLSMGKISVLTQDIINKIAAGEVVERPASVVKELLENAIDAESNEIYTELIDAGKKQILIKDNGHGIHSDDLELSLKRHATSKISKFEDLFSITSLGFRGEALPAIASVSKLTITSKSYDANHGITLLSEYGNIMSKQKKAVNSGTTIIVEELYSNTPARLKFLKRTATELSHCINVVNNYAMAYPSITFKLVHNSRSLFFYPATDRIELRLSNILGTTFKWMTAKSAYEYISGEVFLLDPSKHENRKDIRIFINGRNVADRIVNHAIMSSFERYLSSNPQPVVALFLDIEPAFVDANVSPTKSEVRFREQNLVYSFVQNLLEQAFPKRGEHININFTPTLQKTHFNRQPVLNIAESQRPIQQTTIKEPRNIIGQFKKQYIVLEENDGLVLIDQHAAHERINFEKIVNSLRDTKEVQQLLLTELIELSVEDATTFKQLIPELNHAGFDIEEFEGDGKIKPSFIIRSIPKILEKIDIKELLYNLISDRLDDISQQSVTKSTALIAARLSCHTSIRGGKNLTNIEIENLLNDLENCRYPHTCPHGRPIRIELTLPNIEKMFKRK